MEPIIKLGRIRVIVLDLDETIGYFIQFSILWKCIEVCSGLLNQSQFNTVLDLYPEILRPDIFDILNYLKRKCQERVCHKIILYTNNQGGRKWPYLLKRYFEDHLDYPLFTHVVGAFRTNKKHLEPCRTSHKKNITDLKHCCKLPSGTKVCYLDNKYHELMKHQNVTYVKVISYVKLIENSTIISRFLSSDISKQILDEQSRRHLAKLCAFYLRPYAIDFNNTNEVNSKQILMILDNFFLAPSDALFYRSTNTLKIIATKKRYNRGRYQRTLKIRCFC